MGVEVHWESIYQAWQDDPVEFAFEFQPSSAPPDLDLFVVSADLIDELNEEAADRWEDDPPYVEEFAETPAGGIIALMEPAGEGDEVRTWLTEYAQHIADQGWTGQMRGARRLKLPTWATSAEHLGHALGLFLRLTPQPWNGSHPRGTDTAIDDRTALIEIADLLDARLPTSRAYISRGIFKAEAPEAPPGAAWMRAAERDQFTRLIWVDESTRSASEIRLTPGAKAACALASAVEPWEPRLGVLTQILTQLGPRLEYGVTRTCRPLSSPSESPTVVRPGEDVSTRNLDIAREYVLDVSGVQVLASAHLAKAHDLSSWTITDLGNDRHLVQHPDSAAWYANELPDPDVLAAARHDFGELILTHETYEALRVTQRGPDAHGDK